MVESQVKERKNRQLGKEVRERKKNKRTPALEDGLRPMGKSEQDTAR